MAKAPAKSGGRPAMSAEAKAAREEMLKNESKADRFKRIALPRVTKVLKSIKLLEALASKATYEYTPEQVTQITNALVRAVKGVDDKFNAVKKSKDVSFDFSE